MSGEAVRKMKERVAELREKRPGYQTTTQSSLIEELIHRDHRDHILGVGKGEVSSA